MALKTFYNKGNENAIPINADNLNYNFEEVLNLVYPIGRGFIDFTNTDYSSYLGFTWERELVGLTPVGYDPDDSDFSTIGNTGGSKETEKHSHNLKFQNYPIYGNKSANTDYDNNERVITFNITDTTSTPLNTTSFGTGTSGNLQPFKVVAYWKRTA